MSSTSFSLHTRIISGMCCRPRPGLGPCHRCTTRRPSVGACAGDSARSRWPPTACPARYTLGRHGSDFAAVRSQHGPDGFLLGLVWERNQVSANLKSWPGWRWSPLSRQIITWFSGGDYCCICCWGHLLVCATCSPS